MLIAFAWIKACYFITTTTTTLELIPMRQECYYSTYILYDSRKVLNHCNSAFLLVMPRKKH